MFFIHLGLKNLMYLKLNFEQHRELTFQKLEWRAMSEMLLNFQKDKGFNNELQEVFIRRSSISVKTLQQTQKNLVCCQTKGLINRLQKFFL